MRRVTAARSRARLASADLWRRVGVEQRELAHRQREVLRQPVVDLGGEPQALALERRVLELLPQPRGGDAGAEQVAEQPQHRAGLRARPRPPAPR